MHLFVPFETNILCYFSTNPPRVSFVSLLLHVGLVVGCEESQVVKKVNLEKTLNKHRFLKHVLFFPYKHLYYRLSYMLVCERCDHNGI